MADVEDQPTPKKLKLNENTEISAKINDNIHDNIKDLSDFKPESILSNNTNRKTVCLKGYFDGKDGVGIVLLEKTEFHEDEIKNDDKYFAKECSLEKVFSNDIYGNYKFFPKIELNGIKTTIIHPATDEHIVKYSSQNLYLIDETYNIYKDIVLPHIDKEQLCLQWVYNILNHTSEKDRIIFEDPDPDLGFILLPDLKWNGKSVQNLYLLAIVHRKDLKSLRDLTGEHVSVLNNIYEKGCKTIEEKYKIPSSQLRIYFHYQPSFYHLHIHFTYLKYDAPGIHTERSHMLTTVINNISLLSDYYQKATIPFTLRETDKLYKTFVDKNIIKPVPVENNV